MEKEWTEKIELLEVEKRVLKAQLTNAITKEETAYQRGEKKGFWSGAKCTLGLLAMILFASLIIKYWMLR